MSVYFLFYNVRQNTYFWAGRNSGLVALPVTTLFLPLGKWNHTVGIHFSLAYFINIMFVEVMHHIKHRSSLIIFFL